LKWTQILEKETRAYYTKGHPQITLAVNNALEIYGKTGDYEQAKTTLERILKENSRENGELSFSRVVPNAELIATAEIWSKMLEKQIEDGNLPDTQMDHFLKDFIIYFGNHLSLVLSNARLSDDIRALKRIFAPAIPPIANSWFSSTLPFAIGILFRLKEYSFIFKLGSSLILI